MEYTVPIFNRKYIFKWFILHCYVSWSWSLYNSLRTSLQATMLWLTHTTTQRHLIKLSKFFYREHTCTWWRLCPESRVMIVTCHIQKFWETNILKEASSKSVHLTTSRLALSFLGCSSRMAEYKTSYLKGSAFQMGCDSWRIHRTDQTSMLRSAIFFTSKWSNKLDGHI